MGRWTAAPFDVTCGSAEGTHTIALGEPLYLGPGIIRRCELHAPCEVDWVAVDQARQAMETARAQDAAPRTPSPPRYHRPTRPLTPFAQLRDIALPFDHRAAAARDDD